MRRRRVAASGAELQDRDARHAASASPTIRRRVDGVAPDTEAGAGHTSPLGAAPQSIRDVDLRNFGYPASSVPTWRRPGGDSRSTTAIGGSILQSWMAGADRHGATDQRRGQPIVYGDLTGDGPKTRSSSSATSCRARAPTARRGGHTTADGAGVVATLDEAGRDPHRADEGGERAGRTPPRPGPHRGVAWSWSTGPRATSGRRIRPRPLPAPGRRRSSSSATPGPRSPYPTADGPRQDPPAGTAIRDHAARPPSPCRCRRRRRANRSSRR